MEKMGEGLYNKSFQLTMDDGSVVVDGSIKEITLTNSK